MTDITIKKISYEMIENIAQLHMIAFKGYTNTLIGKSYVRAFIRWFCESNEAIALCAIDKTNNPVGYVVGAPLGYTARLNKKIIGPAMIGIVIRPWLAINPRFRWIVINRIKSLRQSGMRNLEVTPILPSPTISLVGIGVHPDYRGKKIGDELIKEFETNVRKIHAKSMRLSVYKDNIAACKLYEKSGWKFFNQVNQPFVYYYKIL